MSFVLSTETKRSLRSNLLNRLQPLSNLEDDSSNMKRQYLFTPNDVFSVLYGNTQDGFEFASSSVSRAQGFDTSTNISQAEDTDVWCEMYQQISSRDMRSRDANEVQSLDTASRRLTYAVKSIPPECKRCISNTNRTGYGIFANHNIPKGTWIGPFEGRRIRASDVTPDMDTSFMWEIFEGNTLSHFIDASDENSSSWMRFIRCARHKDEQNLFASQYKSNIYYRAFKDIPPGTELLVWYDETYPTHMGIPLGLKESTSVSQEQPVDRMKVPPLIPTGASQQKRPSTVSFLDGREQHLPVVSDANNDTGIHRNNPLVTHPSPFSEFTTWKCQQCHKTFTQRVALQMHVCPRQPENPYQCGQCGQAFTNPSDLRAHVVSHSTERPFKCGYCSRTFVGATTLNNHIRTHLGQKPFGCKKCGKTFSQATQLARHSRDPRGCESDGQETRTTVSLPDFQFKALADGHVAMHS